MESLGDVPVNFLSDVDTTGGNSGSPTLNAKGELVGLLFDGNYESLSAGWIFNPELTRPIHVAARHLLWAMEIGRESCRDIVSKLVSISAVDVSLQKTTINKFDYRILYRCTIDF